MLLSVREIFRRDDPGWNGYLAFIKFEVPNAVYTIDRNLNPLFKGAREVHVEGIVQMAELRSKLPRVQDPSRQYCQLAINIDEEPIPPLPSRVEILGYDLADDTLTSSLLNCGPWEDALEAVARRINRYSLLSFQDAQIARMLLPMAWGEAKDSHSYPDIWCICKVSLVES